MKWVVLLAMLAAIPALTAWLKTNPKEAPWLTGALAALVFVYVPWHLSVAPYPWPAWPGYVRGIQVTLLDCIAIAILLGRPHRGYAVPYRWMMLGYLLAVLIAITQSPLPAASTFYVWQLVRMYLVFKAVAVVSQDDRHWSAVIMGLIVGLAYQTLEAVWGKLHGMVQTGGTLGHQNMLGMLTNIVLMPALAMAMAGIRTRWAALGIGAGALALVSTASRGSITIGALGIGLVLLLSVIRRPSGRKAGVVGLAVLGLAVTAPLALKSLSGRFGGSDIRLGLDSDEVRVKMEKAAEMMIADHPFGVGSNYFVVAANKGNYWSRVGVPVTRGNMGAHVHNSYLLVEAETGFIGLAMALLVLFSTIVYPLYVSFKYRAVLYGEVLVGLAVSVVTFVVHNRVEWGIVNENIQYMLAIIFGLSAGLARRTTMAARNAKRPRPRQTAETPGSAAAAGRPALQPNGASVRA